ncbi:hexitol phosphatase HxpB [Lonsdalea quercina]|uniref:hexitol phosphatase HxpB n=1 Tax=Lonsdalea quercina TaxID=71657 RepID=UPI003976297C
MPAIYPINAAIFDMDGLLIDSEPFWERSIHEVISGLGVDMSSTDGMPDLLGLRIDMVVALWYQHSPWKGPSKDEVTTRIIKRTIQCVEEARPLLPGVEQALQLCRSQNLKIGLASASPLFMLEQVLEMFNLRDYFDTLMSADQLPYSKPHPEVYLRAAQALDVSPLACVTLEDSVNGMIATKAARMRSIVVPAAEMRHDPRWALADVKLASLQELTAAHIY